MRDPISLAFLLAPPFLFTRKEKAEYKTDCCPVCRRPLGTSQFVKAQTGKVCGAPYCKRCGQRIIWEG